MSPNEVRVRLLGGAILVSTGLVWLAQGTGLLPGSFMTGDPFWAWLGAAAIVVGAAILTWAWRARGSNPP